MRFAPTFFAIVAAASTALAVEFTDYPSEVEAGRGYRLQWTPADDVATTMVLRKGNPEALDTIGELANDAQGGSWVWRVDSELKNAEDYALEIKREGEESNYSGQIKLTGGAEEGGEEGAEE